MEGRQLNARAASAPTRRALLRAGLGLAAGSPLLAPGRARAQVAASCVAPAAATPAQTAGPFFLAGAPLRGSLRGPDIAGEPFRLEGRLVDARCGPLPNARVDLWQADGRGAYDTQGFRLRGHLLTDAEGRFAFDTVRPGRYPGRTPHFHLRVTPARGATLTTQLYFPAEPGNARDSIFRPELLLALPDAANGRATLVLA